MDNEQAAREIVKILKKPLIEYIDLIIEQRCVITIAKVLEIMKEKNNKKE
jgi:hypothetical protein